jgi:hypothetical protein
MNIKTDTNLAKKLNSDRYNLSMISKETGISRYLLNEVKNEIPVKPFIIIALQQYFKTIGE